MALDKFTINRTTRNEYSIVIKQTGTTLPMEIVESGKTVDHTTSFTPSSVAVIEGIATEVSNIDSALSTLYSTLDEGYDYIKYTKADAKKQELIVEEKQDLYQDAISNTTVAVNAETTAENEFNAGLVLYNTLESAYLDLLASGLEETDQTVIDAKAAKDAQFTVVYGVDGEDSAGLDYALSVAQANTLIVRAAEEVAENTLTDATDVLLEANSEVLNATDYLTLVNNILGTLTEELVDYSSSIFAIQDADTLLLKKQLADAATSAYLATVTSTLDFSTELNTAKTTIEASMTSIGTVSDTIISNLVAIEAVDSEVHYKYTDTPVEVTDLLENLEIADHYTVGTITITAPDGVTVGHTSPSTSATFTMVDTTTEMANEPEVIAVLVEVTLVLANGIDSDVFSAQLIELSTGEVSSVVPVVTVEDGLQGRIELVIEDASTLETLRGTQADRYYLRPTYKLLIEAITVNNGQFVATVPEVYVD